MLTDEEHLVLYYTYHLKRSHNGMDYRFREASLKGVFTSLERWETVKKACICKGFMNVAEAVTEAGKIVLKRESIFTIEKRLRLSQRNSYS